MKSLCESPFDLLGKVDLMLWDPPYNTGNKGFMYNDRFGSHESWLSFMKERLIIAKDMLKETGSIAIHIGYKELFRLGILIDEVFGESNRVGIINWECTYSPKNDSKGIPSTTDYVLIYAKDRRRLYRGLMPRTAEMDSRYKHDFVKETIQVGSRSGNPKHRYGIEIPIPAIFIIHQPEENL